MSEQDPYAYPGSQVLRNKFGLQDGERLQQFEYRRSAERALEMAVQPVQGKFDFAHLKAIHRQLFQDVYDWAGRPRTVGIAKGASTFAMPEQIESYGKKVFDDLAGERHLRGLDKPTFVARLAFHFSEINALHPFREGNGRSSRVFLGLLAQAAGYELDFSKVDAAGWNEASRASFAGDLAPITEIFGRVVAPARAVSFDQDRREDALRKHPELLGAFRVLDAADHYFVTNIPDAQRREQCMRLARTEISARLHRSELLAEATPVRKVPAHEVKEAKTTKVRPGLKRTR